MNLIDKKKLMYLEPGDRRAGLCSYVMQVIAMAKPCKDNNMPMYIDFSKDMLYHKQEDPNGNVWDYFFEQPFPNLNLNDYELERAVWYQDNRPWNPPMRFDSKSDYLKVARQLCREFVKLKPELTTVGDKFIQENTNGRFLSVHKRGCDHENRNQFRLEHYFIETDKHIDKFDKLLVCSDEQHSVDAFKQRYGSKVFSYSSHRAQSASEGVVGAHNLPNSNNFVYQNGYDCLVEAYMMSRSSFLLKTVSNVTSFAVMNSDDLDFIWIDANYGCNY
jgi:hypothetical protein